MENEIKRFSIKKNIEQNKKLRITELIIFFILIITSISLFVGGIFYVNRKVNSITYQNTIEMKRNIEDEDYDSDSKKCDVIYYSSDNEEKMIITYNYDEYEKLDENHTITAYSYKTDLGDTLYFLELDPLENIVNSKSRSLRAENYNYMFSIATSLLILGISLAVILFFSKVFSIYEKCWFISIMILATIFSILLPEEAANGVSGIWIMLLYLLDTFLNILCELLISKQNRYNFLVSIFVEITEILICVVLMYRFATMATTLFFWLPIDILSFINWSRHKDKEEIEKTIVRRLKGWQEFMIILGIAVWTIVIGYLLSGINITSDLFKGNERLETIVIYMDACVSAVGICNGLFIFFRFREQWIAWYLDAILEAAINILSGQYILLILKLGYLTNTTYGYIKWSKYIKKHELEENA